MMQLSFKKIYFLCFLCVCVLLATIAFYTSSLDVTVCPLAQLERFLMLLLALFFLAVISYNHTPFSKKVWSWLIIFVSVCGVVVAGRHGWLQRIASDQISVSGLLGRLQDMPFLGYLSSAFTAQSCSIVEWTKFGLSVADWLMLFFLLFAVVAFMQQRRKDL